MANGKPTLTDPQARRVMVLRRSAVVPAIIVAVIAVSFACEGQESPTRPEGLPSNAVPVDFEPLGEGLGLGFMTLGGPREPARLVIRQQEEWAEFWSGIGGPRVLAAAAPSVDFDSKMVVVAAMGQRPTGGYGVAVEGVYDSSGELYVEVLEWSPTVGCFTTQAFTAPVAIVVVSARDGPVHFMERKESKDC